MANQIGTESQIFNDKIMELEIKIAFLEFELEQAGIEYQFHLLGPAEQLAILNELSLDGFPARLVSLKKQAQSLVES